MWSRHLQATLKLKDGRRIETVHDAVDLIDALPRDRRTAELWEAAVDALASAERGHASHLDLATAQRRLTTALRAEGML